MGIMLALRAFNTLIVIGILRSGGDTKYALFLELGCMWFVSIPLTFLAAIKGAPIYILVLLSYSEEIAKFIFGVPRALSKKWANNIVKKSIKKSLCLSDVSAKHSYRQRYILATATDTSVAQDIIF